MQMKRVDSVKSIKYAQHGSANFGQLVGRDCSALTCRLALKAIMTKPLGYRSPDVRARGQPRASMEEIRYSIAMALTTLQLDAELGSRSGVSDPT